jgi:hypothetical protein
MVYTHPLNFTINTTDRALASPVPYELHILFKIPDSQGGFVTKTEV